LWRCNRRRQCVKSTHERHSLPQVDRRKAVAHAGVSRPTLSGQHRSGTGTASRSMNSDCDVTSCVVPSAEFEAAGAGTRRARRHEPPRPGRTTSLPNSGATAASPAKRVERQADQCDRGRFRHIVRRATGRTRIRSTFKATGTINTGSSTVTVTYTNPFSPKVNQPKRGLSSSGADYCLRRRDAASPARPRPRSAAVPGSGTVPPLQQQVGQTQQQRRQQHEPDDCRQQVTHPEPVTAWVASNRASGRRHRSHDCARSGRSRTWVRT
jgi:hypothetical protein